MKRSFTYIILLYLLTIGCSGKSASVIGGANGSTEIIVADCDTDTILTGDDLEKFDTSFQRMGKQLQHQPDNPPQQQHE